MRSRYLLLASLISPYALASDDPSSPLATCLVLPPPLPSSVTSLLADVDKQLSERQQTIQISSDQSYAEFGQQAEFSGNVVISQGSRVIRADSARFDQQNESLEALGQLYLQDSSLVVTADALTANMNSNQAQMTGANYWLKGQQIHGDADTLEITPESNLLLSNTSFTTCPDPSNGWELEAKDIKIDGNEEWGEIWDAKLKIADVPVLYIPYMTVPVSDKRKTGFLFPSFSTSTTNGMEIHVPWYWNISPEYDFTFTPVYMSNRGLFLKNEFRYLAGEAQLGQFNVEYPDTDDELTGSPNRHLLHWSHQGKIDRNWRVMANYTDVSDNNFFNDLQSDVGQSTDNQLVREGEVSYFQQNWNASVRVQDIQVLGTNEEPYRVMPQLAFNYYQPDLWRGYDFSLYSEVTNFSRTFSGINPISGQPLPSATRLHLEPSIRWPWYGPAGSLIAEAKVYQTEYWQRSFGDNSGLADHVSRTIPQLRLYGQMNFERPVFMLNKNYRHVLEPQAQYLYIGHTDQSDIGLYDTATLQEDYYSLFRDRRYSGLDRIANTSQITLGATNRLFNSHNEEIMTFSLGQIFFFDDNKVPLLPEFVEEEPSFSVLAAELDAHLFDKYYVSAGAQYDTEESSYRKSEVTLDYRHSVDELVQLSYRYVPDLLNSNTREQADISQTGLRMTWPLRDDLYFVGNWYYDLKEKRSVEIYTGFQYESCCWALRLSYHHHLKTNYDDTLSQTSNREQFDRGIYLNFVIKGLGGTGPLGVGDMLDQGIFNYRQPLYLRN